MSGTIANDEILTGEAVALDVQPLGVMPRAVGALLDMLVSIAIIVGAFYLFSVMASAGILSEAMLRIATISTLAVVLVGLPTTVETLSGGRSLGKLAMGGRIVRADGGAIGFRHAFIRALLGVLEVYMLLGTLALIVAIFTPRAQRLGDLTAGTYSERTRAKPVASFVVPMPPALTQWAGVADVARLPDRLGRRLAQFAASADRLPPYQRARFAHELAEEASPYVSPRPPVDDETFLFGVVAARRAREYRALQFRAAQAARLTGQRH